MAQILSPDEAKVVRSKGLYWREVAQRGSGAGEILRAELRDLYQDIGLKLLWVTLDYAERMESAAEGEG